MNDTPEILGAETPALEPVGINDPPPIETPAAVETETPAETAVEAPAEAPSETAAAPEAAEGDQEAAAARVSETETAAEAAPEASDPNVQIVADGQVAMVGAPPQAAETAVPTDLKAIEAALREALAAKVVRQNAAALSEDEALGVETIPGRTLPGTKEPAEFKLTHPSIFGRRDMVRALASMAGDARDANDESDEAVKLEKTARIFEAQVKIVLPCLSILDRSTMQFREAALDEAGYGLDDESLAKVLAGVMGPINPEAELKDAGIPGKSQAPA